MIIAVDPVKAAEIDRQKLPRLSAIQLRLALFSLGLTGDDVAAQIAAMPGAPTEREAARIHWEYATEFPRSHPLISVIGAALGLTEAQIDAAWLQAAAL